MLIETNYIDKKGRAIVISEGIGEKGTYSVYAVKPNGSLQRIKSPEFTPTPHLELLKERLNVYAETKKWGMV